MAHQLTWMRPRLLDAGLKVAEVPGWQDRGRGPMGLLSGVMVHHTAGPLKGNMPSLDTLVRGRSDLPGPLSQLGLGRDGTWYLIAAGRANHAGAGRWRGVDTGNSSFIGIEAENAGTEADLHWPAVQRDSLVRGAAVLLKELGRGPEWLVGHKEYALPPGRKPDPRLDMDRLRDDVALALAGQRTSELIPAAELAGSSPRPRATLRRGSQGEDVDELQMSLGLVVDGSFGPRTEARVREWQREQGIVPDGIFGPRSWARLDAVMRLVPRP